MPSSYTERSRLILQATGENSDTWGDFLNNGGFELIDAMADGVVVLSSPGSVTQTTANGTDDQARQRILRMTATSTTTVTIPSVEKLYFVLNTSTADHILTNGSSSVTVYAGERTAVLTDGSTLWKFVANDFPTPTANRQAATKKYVDDTAFASTTLPGQAGNAGKFVTTDGTVASWSDITIALVAGLQAALDALDAAVVPASAADYRSDTGAQFLPVDKVWDAAEIVTVTYATPLALDFDTFINAEITLTGNIVLNAPTNAKPGQSGFIRLIQDGTGSRTATFNAAFKFNQGLKTLTTTASAVDYLFYTVISSSLIVCSLVKAPS